MTVTKLIEALQKCPPDYVVAVDTGDINLMPINSVEEYPAFNVVLTSDFPDDE